MGDDEPEDAPRLSREQCDELMRRLKAADADGARGVPWEEVRERLLARRKEQEGADLAPCNPSLPRAQ
ncbi:MAG: addiction module protein [Gemmataceae bacterium]|nr:addiction module protein [Gemmataceae bacterium]